MTNKNLAIKLATAEKEEGVINLLKDLGYWDNYCYWRSFGDNDNNFSTIGNQQSKGNRDGLSKYAERIETLYGTLDLDEWNEATIYGRAEHLASAAVNTWKEC